MILCLVVHEVLGEDDLPALQPCWEQARTLQMPCSIKAKKLDDQSPSRCTCSSRKKSTLLLRSCLAGSAFHKGQIPHAE